MDYAGEEAVFLFSCSLFKLPRLTKVVSCFVDSGEGVIFWRVVLV